MISSSQREEINEMGRPTQPLIRQEQDGKKKSVSLEGNSY